MPWAGPTESDPWPTLGRLVGRWIEEHCVVPDGERAGEPFRLTPEQARFLLWFYRLREDATPEEGKPSAPFIYRRAQLVRSQKWGKGPLAAALICAEAAGPVLFDGWDAAGQPVGKPWPTPWVQVVAVSEDQTLNTFGALLPMIELGPLSSEAALADTGRTRININTANGSQGRIEPVTSAAISRLGARITFAIFDETGFWVKSNQGVALADTLRRNLAGMGGRAVETTNAWDPAENSVAQATYESKSESIFCDYPQPPKGSIRNKRERRAVLRKVYGDSAAQAGGWVDLDRIDAEIEELLARDPNQAERFFLNRVIAGSDRAFDLKLWQGLADTEHEVPKGALITLGFDGARRQDATALIGTEIETGYQFTLGVWARPSDRTDDDWEVPEAEVDDLVRDCFTSGRYEVVRFYADPFFWESTLDKWAGEFGTSRVTRYATNTNRRMAYALQAWVNDWAAGNLSHSGDPVLTEHIGNATRYATKIRDESGGFLWVIRKDGAKSPRKIDAAMAACLSWQARNDALRSGALKKPDSYQVAGW